MADETTQSWTVGSARITAVVEAQTDHIPPVFFFPDADEALILRHRSWLAPHFADDEGRINLRVQAFVVEQAGRTAVVDPCVGNGKTRSLPFWNQQEWPFMERFVAAGLDRSAVDLVVHTHLHADHVGWDTHLADGRWVPTFPNARHLYVQAELDWLQGLPSDDPGGGDVHDDSIAPIFDAGLADIVEPDADLGGGVRLEPTVGHTPGHVSVWVESEGTVALLSGDFLHHPVQCAVPDLAEVGDDDVAAARATRHAMLERAADEEVLFLGTHFGTRPGGHVVPDPDGGFWRYRPL
jgi:glyoxylase-like metal-dependent hydrolase (beta-lactamase superfamily II)